MSRSEASESTPQYLGVYRLVPRLYAREAWTDADNQAVMVHFDRLQDLARQGVVIMSGRTQESFDRTFGLVIFECDDEAGARRFMDADPAVAAGVMVYTIHPYKIAAMR